MGNTGSSKTTERPNFYDYRTSVDCGNVAISRPTTLNIGAAAQPYTRQQRLVAISPDQSRVQRYEVWFSCSPQMSLPDDLSYSDLTIGGIKSNTRGESIISMAIREDIPPLYEIASNLKCLRVRNIPCTEQLEHLNNLKDLEFLDLQGNTNLKTLPIWFGGLKSLRILNLSGCWKLKLLPQSLRNLPNIEVLDLSEIIYQQEIPSIVGEMLSLTKLLVRDCELCSLPESLQSLQKLEFLDLSGNTSLRDLPVFIGSMTNLVTLDAHNCGLTQLPESLYSLSKLQALSISDNPLRRLPDKIADLRNLKKLHAACCELEHIPQSMSDLIELHELDLSDNPALTAIPEGVFMRRNLHTVDCDGCDNLTSPPISVCTQGVEAVRKYMSDLEVDREKNVKFVPVTVIGQAMAGKTSLVRSMQHNKRILARRSKSSELDETTKVFKVSEAEVDQQSKLVMFDFGGQAVYQFAYQLAFGTRNVPLLTVDIAEFDRVAAAEGTETACEKLCFKWLSQLYLSCPQLGQPIVALTHSDEISDKLLEQRKQELIATTEALRKKTIREEETTKSSVGAKLPTFSDQSKPLLETVIVFSKDSGVMDINQLKSCLIRQGLSLLTEIPASWYEIIEFSDGQTEKPFLLISELDTKFPGDKDHFALQYLHEIGRLKWYKLIDELSGFVFHRIEVLTKLIELIFDHSSKEAWNMRVERFECFKYLDQLVSKERYKQMVRKFQNTGIMDGELLHNLLEKESSLPSEIAIDVLKAFHLICGPINEEKHSQYIVPCFSTDTIVPRATLNSVPLKIMIRFHGLQMPSYVYHLITALFLKMHITDFNQVAAGKNGAQVIDLDGTTKYLLHSNDDGTVSLLSYCAPSEIKSAWIAIIDSLLKITENLKTFWKGVNYEKIIHCSHCLLRNPQGPGTPMNPRWVEFPVTSDKPLHDLMGRFHVFSGKEEAPCPLSEDLVPAPLVFPCSDITENGIKKLELFVSNMQQENTVNCMPEGAALMSYTAIPESLIQTLVKLVNSSDDPLLDLVPAKTVEEDLTSIPAQLVYPNTETRGRALILSNDFNGSRKGSLKDYRNIKLMLDRFGFVTSGEHGNYTAEDMVRCIHIETQLINTAGGESIHEQLGAFVLVITSHGDEGSVIGVDGHHIKITDIMDLLSPKNFPAMKGKPKIIIIQACSGDKRELLLEEIVVEQTDSLLKTTKEDKMRCIKSSSDEDVEEIDSASQDISTADFIVMQSSYDSFSSPRRNDIGSVFVRALVVVFYNFAHNHHIEDLAKIVREVVAECGIQRTNQLKKNPKMKNAVSAQVASMPKTVCTFLRSRLFLQPGFRMRDQDQPESFVNPILPERTKTKIEQLDYVIRTETHGGDQVKQASFYKWKVRH